MRLTVKKRRSQLTEQEVKGRQKGLVPTYRMRPVVAELPLQVDGDFGHRKELPGKVEAAALSKTAGCAQDRNRGAPRRTLAKARTKGARVVYCPAAERRSSHTRCSVAGGAGSARSAASALPWSKET